MAKNQREFAGLERGQEIRQSTRRESTDGFWKRWKKSHDDPNKVWQYYGVVALFTLPLSFFPFIPDFVFFICLLMFLSQMRFRKRSWRAPFRVPAYAGKEGFKDETTGKKGTGDVYLGLGMGENDGLEVWASTNDIRTHRMVVGTTGSGKTEELFGSVFNALVCNSGALMVDGKASPKTFNRILAMARMFGREEELFLMNYIMGGKDYQGYSSTKISNTYNPFSIGSSQMKSELMSNLLSGQAGGGQSGDFWKDRAISLLDAIMPPLTYLSERGYILFNPRTMAAFFNLNNIENLIWFGQFRDLNGRTVKLAEENALDFAGLQKVSGSLRLLVEQLPGYEMSRPSTAHKFSDSAEDEIDKELEAGPEAVERWAKQYTRNWQINQAEKSQATSQGADQARSQVYQQWGYMTMQLVRATAILTFEYGHIFNDEVGEINFRDLFLNRRLMFVAIPSLERNPASMGVLAKLVVASIKGVLAIMLDSPFEGDRRRIVEGRPSNAVIPYNMIFDEYGYYVVEGFSVAPAQAREFGVSVTFGVQALESLSKSSPTEGAETWVNTNLRHAGRTTAGEESETFKKFQGAAGQGMSNSTKVTFYNRHQAGGAYSRGNEIVSELENRIQYSDLNGQQNGEFHLIVGVQDDVKDGRAARSNVRVVRYQAFYTGDVEAPEVWRLNHFVQIKPPTAAKIAEHQNRARLQEFIDRKSVDLLTEWQRQHKLLDIDDTIAAILKDIPLDASDAEVKAGLGRLQQSQAAAVARAQVDPIVSRLRENYVTILDEEGVDPALKSALIDMFNFVTVSAVKRSEHYWQTLAGAKSQTNQAQDVVMRKVKS